MDRWMMIWQLVVAALSGVVLGILYFGGLWWTVRRLPGTPHPWRLYLISYGLRVIAVLLTCWALLAWGDWWLLVVCLSGWWLVRFLLIHYGALT